MIYCWLQTYPYLYYLPMTPICFAPVKNLISLSIKSMLNLVVFLYGESKLEKTYFMLFALKGVSRDMDYIRIDGHRVEEVRQTKFLGVILDNKLDWHAHRDYICCKMSKGIGIIIKARKVFNAATLLSFDNSLILPYVSSCIHAWGRAFDKHMKHVMVLQKWKQSCTGHCRCTSTHKCW